MALDTAIFAAVAPQYASTPVATLNTLYGLAEHTVNDDVWTDWAEHGKALLVAHMLAMAERGSASGPVESERVGDLSRTYAIATTTSTDDDSLNETAYGREFLRVRRGLTVSPFFAI